MLQYYFWTFSIDIGISIKGNDYALIPWKRELFTGGSVLCCGKMKLLALRPSNSTHSQLLWRETMNTHNHILIHFSAARPWANSILSNQFLRFVKNLINKTVFLSPKSNFGEKDLLKKCIGFEGRSLRSSLLAVVSDVRKAEKSSSCFGMSCGSCVNIFASLQDLPLDWRI